MSTRSGQAVRVRRDPPRLGHGWLGLGLVAMLAVACGGRATPSAASPSAAPASASPASSPTPIESPSPSPAIDRLRAFIPSAIWSACEPSVQAQFATTLQSATCRYPGVDQVTYQVFGSSTDLDTAYASILEGTRAKPSTDLATACANGNWHGTWTRDGTSPVPGNGLECDVNSSGAWVVQVDPKVKVLFQANLASGDGAALYAWWRTNVTIVESGT